MLAFAIRRLLWTAGVLFAITLIVFAIFFLTPGVDPAVQLAGKNPAPSTIAHIRHDYGLDRSAPVQYLTLMKKLFITHDLTSYSNQGISVIPQLVKAVPVTLSLVFGAALLWIVGSLVVGVAATRLRGTLFDPLLMACALLGVSIPVFWLAQMANLLTQHTFQHSFLLGWVPQPGYVPLLDDPLGWFTHLLVPWFVLATLNIGLYARVLRADLIDAEHRDYVRTARAKGLGERIVVWRHALRNALIPVITVLGLDFGSYLTGSILTETVFSWPGLGRYVVNAIGRRDLPAIQGSVLFLSVVFVLVNLLTDLAYAKADPRVTYA